MRSPNPSWAAVLGLGLAAAVLAVVGCDSRPTPPPSMTVNPVAASKSRAATPGGDESGAKLFADWPTPAGALFITGEQVGYLEPCGCTAGQKGGLARRFAFAERLRAQGWPLIPIDLGSLIEDPAAARGGPFQTQIKLGIALKSLMLMKYDALALAPADLKPTVQDSLMLLANTLDERLKVVAANVKPATSGIGYESKLRPSIRAQAGPIKVGITAVLDPEAVKSLRDDTLDLLSVEPIEAALPPVLADLEKDTNLQVLMVQGPPELAKRLARAHPGFDLVVATTAFVDPPREPETLNDGKTWLIQVGKKGQYVGVVGLYQDSDPTRRLRYQRQMLSDRFDKLKAMAAPMRALIEDEFQTELKAADVLATYPRKPYAFMDRTPADSTYVGAKTCAECHPSTYAKWLTTKHAHAYEPLTDPKRNREADAECVSCHTTGFPYLGGFVTASKTPDLKGNQCENCHGPGSKHAAEPDNADYRRAVARSAEEFDKSHRCIDCHDEDNSPHGFDFKTMYGKIAHKGLDRYDDPKVHRGIAPRKAGAGD